MGRSRFAQAGRRSSPYSSGKKKSKTRGVQKEFLGPSQIGPIGCRDGIRTHMLWLIEATVLPVYYSAVCWSCYQERRRIFGATLLASGSINPATWRLLPRNFSDCAQKCKTAWSAQRDLNPRNQFGRLVLCRLNYTRAKGWSSRCDSNARHSDYKADALPSELRKRMIVANGPGGGI